MKNLTFVTGNLKKVEEILLVFSNDLPFLVEHKSLELPELQGDLEFIVKNKCLAASRLVNGPVLVEDTSMSINAWNGLPGPYLKWFIDSIGNNGIYRMVKDWEDKSATMNCRIAFCRSPNAQVHIFEGSIKGAIVDPLTEPSDDPQFPCFLPDYVDPSMADSKTTTNFKSTRLHRFKAAMVCKEFLIQENYND